MCMCVCEDRKLIRLRGWGGTFLYLPGEEEAWQEEERGGSKERGEAHGWLVWCLFGSEGSEGCGIRMCMCDVCVRIENIDK